MKYAHRFQIQAPLKEVAEFHLRPGNMAAITPPPVIVQMHKAPGRAMQEGDEMEFTLWVLFLPIRWRARIENVTPTGFRDRQLRGPFAEWRHKRTFVPISVQVTEVLDEIEAEPGRGLFGKLISMGMWLNLPVLFAYRAWRTRSLLHRQACGADTRKDAAAQDNSQ